MLSFKIKDDYLAFSTVLSYTAFTYLHMKRIRGKTLRIWIRNTAVFLANLRVCHWAWDSKEICGFAIYESIIKNL